MISRNWLINVFKGENVPASFYSVGKTSLLLRSEALHYIPFYFDKKRFKVFKLLTSLAAVLVPWFNSEDAFKSAI